MKKNKPFRFKVITTIKRVPIMTRTEQTKAIIHILKKHLPSLTVKQLVDLAYEILDSIED